MTDKRIDLLSKVIEQTITWKVEDAIRQAGKAEKQGK